MDRIAVLIPCYNEEKTIEKVVMVAQAFKECKPKHYAAIGIAMVPSIADYLFTQVEASLATGSMAEGGWGIWSETLESGLKGFSDEISEMLIANGAMWNGVPAVKSGAIIIGILLASMCVFMIDKKLRSAALIALSGAVLSLFGFIHNAELGFYPTSPFMIGWLIVAVLLFIFTHVFVGLEPDGKVDDVARAVRELFGAHAEFQRLDAVAAARELEPDVLAVSDRLDRLDRQPEEAEQRLRIARAEGFEHRDHGQQIGGDKTGPQLAVERERRERHLHRFCVLVDPPAERRNVRGADSEARRLRVAAEMGQQIAFGVDRVVE